MSAHWMSAPWNRLGDSRLSESRLSGMTPENSIPADLILNWDLRGMRMVPVNNWTLTSNLRRTPEANGTDITGEPPTQG